MGQTVVQRAALAAAEACYEEAEDAQVMVQARKRLREGFYGDDAAFYGQYFARARGWADDGEVYSFVQAYAAKQSGQVTEWRIPVVGQTPSRDKAWEQNQEALSAGLPKTFAAEVYEASPGNDADGWFAWSPQDLHPWVDGDKVIPPPFGGAPRDDDSKIVYAPLEIGYSAASTTWWHLLREGAVARWPYGREEIALFVANEVLMTLSEKVGAEERRIMRERCGLPDA